MKKIFLIFGTSVIFGIAAAGASDNVSGWAWSSNIGWVSFNCTNPGAGSCAPNYGVNIDSGTGNFSGYAWSEHIGWISFNETAGCPATAFNPSCRPKVEGGFSGSFPKQVSGWAKILSTGNWISLRGANYGVQLESSGDFSGWSWEDQDVGWLSWRGTGYGVQASFIVLTVAPAGDGSGTISGPGINCGSDCSESYDLNTSISLTVTPAADSYFAGWSGACSGVGACNLTMDSSKVVTATFKKSAVPGGIKEVKP